MKATILSACPGRGNPWSHQLWLWQDEAFRLMSMDGMGHPQKGPGFAGSVVAEQRTRSYGDRGSARNALQQ